MFYTKFVIVLTLLIFFMVYADAKDKLCRFGKGQGKEKRCDDYCRNKYNRIDITDQDNPYGYKVPVTIGRCVLGGCFCRLNRKLKESKSYWERAKFYVNKSGYCADLIEKYRQRLPMKPDKSDSGVKEPPLTDSHSPKRLQSSASSSKIELQRQGSTSNAELKRQASLRSDSDSEDDSAPPPPTPPKTVTPPPSPARPLPLPDPPISSAALNSPSLHQKISDIAAKQETVLAEINEKELCTKGPMNEQHTSACNIRCQKKYGLVTIADQSKSVYVSYGRCVRRYHVLKKYKCRCSVDLSLRVYLTWWSRKIKLKFHKKGVIQELQKKFPYIESTVDNKA